jgi:hypothetical protein
MSLRKGEWILVAFNLFYIAAFAAYYFSIRNYEFLWYVATLVFFFVLIAITLKRSKFDYTILWGLSFWGLLHMAGGGVIVNGEVLYRLHLIPVVGSGDLFVLKFDQFVHFYGFGVATFVVHHLLRPYLNEKTNWKVVYPILIAAGSGLGVLNEIVEFTAFVSLSETGVGGYENTLLDLIFNTLGASAAVILIHVRGKMRESGEKVIPISASP